jgi:hypothetical protein
MHTFAIQRHAVLALLLLGLCLGSLAVHALPNDLTSLAHGDTAEDDLAFPTWAHSQSPDLQTWRLSTGQPLNWLVVCAPLIPPPKA